MNLVIDSNIIFSTLLNPNSVIGELVMNVQDDLNFFGPELLIHEIERYTDKISLYSKLEKSEIEQLKALIFRSINFISEDLIKDKNWESAYDLTKDIDQNDTPFVALALELSCKLWTGDKKLQTGFLLKNNDLIITTLELKKYFKNKF